MRITIKKLEKGSTFNNETDGEVTVLQQWRITDNLNRVYLSWIPNDRIIPQEGKTYSAKQTGETIAYFNGDKAKSKYNKISLIEEVEVSGNEKPSTILSIPFEGENTPQPTQIVSMGSDSDYHQMAQSYLSSIGKLSLINLNELAPHYKSICEGTISEPKLGELNLKYYGE